MARVLLVEDEPNIASIIVFKLEREGHEVRWEASALAVAAAARMRPGLGSFCWTPACRTAIRLSSSASSPSGVRS
jgi:CheY-like chemotaxis protein